MTVLALPFGRFGIQISNGRVQALRFLPPEAELRPPIGDLAQRTTDSILRWLDDPTFVPELPFAAQGTTFQHRVWQAIATIPCGNTSTYGALARALDSAPRAVGQACGANPFPLFVPCHRVTAAAGIGGFANARDGWLIEAKRWLLANEGGR